ncbi:MAG: FUSC family protein [Thermoleophilia bacterium]
MDRAAFRAGLRAAAAVAVGFTLGRYVLDEPQFAVFASFTALALLAFADYGGPMRARLGAIGVTIMVALVLVTLGTVTSESAWGSPIVVGLVAFAVAYAQVLGGYFVAGANTVILFVVLSTGMPVPDGALGWRLAGTIVGGALAAAATAFMWPERRDRDLGASLGRAAAALRDCLARDGDREAAVDRARTEVRAVRARLAAPGPRAGEPTVAYRAGLRLVADLDRLLDRIGRSVVRLAEPLPAAEPLLELSSRSLDAAAVVLGGGAPVADPVALRREARALLPATRARLAADGARDPAAFAVQAEALAVAGEVAHAATRAALDAHVVTGRMPSAPDPAIAPLLADRPMAVARRRLRANLTFRSVHFRNALRVGLALAAALILVHAFALSHGFWVVLATLTVVRSASSTTGLTARQVLLGTAVGFVLALLVVLGAERDAHLYAVLLGLVIWGAVYAQRTHGLVGGQAGFTVLVVVLFGLLAPTTWTLALVRVEDVVLGACVGVLIGVVAWPRGPAGQLPGALAALVERAATTVRAEGAYLLGRAPAPGPELEHATLMAARRVEDDLAVALAERSPDLGRAQTWPGLLADTVELWYSAWWVATLPPRRLETAGCPRLSGALEARLGAVTDGYDGAAEALREGFPPPAPPGPARDDVEVARCVAAAAHAGEREALVGALAIRSWVRELEAGLGRMTDRLRTGPLRAEG